MQSDANNRKHRSSNEGSFLKLLFESAPNHRLTPATLQPDGASGISHDQDLLNLVVVALLATGSVQSAPVHAAPSNVPSAAVSAEQVRYRTLNVDGVEVFYRETGPADAPVLLLLHGFPTSSHMFRDLMPRLAQRYRVIAPDYPGFDNYARVVDKFTQQLGLNKYALYVMDYGAPVGFRLATAHPERVPRSSCRTAMRTTKALPASGTRSRPIGAAVPPPTAKHCAGSPA